MDTATKNYIDSLDRRSIPWNRMFTAYGTAEHYNELLSVLEETTDEALWKKTFNRISDFEHQSTMFPPAPFVLVFLVRILQKRIQDGFEDGIVQNLIDQCTYYADVCKYAEEMEHAQPLGHFWDLLDDDEVFENPDVIPDELFYSFYYYSKVVLSQVEGILKTTAV